MRVEKRYHTSTALPHITHNANHTVLVYHAEFGAYAVASAFVDSEIVERARNRVVYHVRHNKIEVTHIVFEHKRIHISGLLHKVELLLHLHNLSLQLGIASVEVFVDVVQAEIGGHIVCPLVNGRSHAAGRCDIHVLPVWVILKKQHAAYHHQKGEDKPLAVLYKK